MFKPQTKILVVDDFTSMRKVTIQVLQQLGFTNFVEAGDGYVAWNALTKIEPPIQLIICDWNMPGGSGLDFLKKVRARQTYQQIPFLMCTTKSEKESVLLAVEHGADNFIIKPFTLEVFEKKLESVFKKMSEKFPE
jgi:two-component system chemotaxis response regulator CheY